MLLECSFLIPLTRDAETSDGDFHTTDKWEWLDDALVMSFGGRTIAPGKYEGIWRSAKTRSDVNDQSTMFIVAVADEKLSLLRAILKRACVLFRQQCIYASIGGRVEFVQADTHD